MSAGATHWTIDPTHTLVEFSAKHMMITTVKGRFTGVSGSVVVDGAASTVSVDIDASTIQTGVEQRDGHLQSADFLDVGTFPQVTFRSTGIEGDPASEGASFRVNGELTIRGTTRPVTLEATFDGSGKDPWGGERASFSASTRIDRRDFGLVWNQALESGGILVGHEVRIALEVQLTRAA